MPLLRRQPFHREKPPPDLKADEEVFFCKLTREVFRDYEKFFERIILCNSLVWSCAITGRSGLTYQEAEESEEKALKQLASFPSYLQKPILYLATKTRRSRIADLNDDVFVFAKDRYFKGEVVDVLSGPTKKTCKIVNVIPPGSSTPKSPSVKSLPQVNGDGEEVMQVDEVKKSPEKKVSKKPEAFKYVVQVLDKPTVSTVAFKMISRKKGLFTRDKCKLFLKQSSENEDGVWKIKAAKIKKFGLDKVEFDDIFAGLPPKFEFSEIKLKKPAPKKPESKESSPAPSKTQKLAENAKKNAPISQLTLEEMKALKEQEKIQREKEKEEKLAQKIREREELRRKFEEEKEKKRKEKALEMEKKREEKRIQAEMWREWSRHRDDLECDDLKLLPEPTAVNSRIPIDHFGDAVMVVEFVNCFSSIFDLKASFPKGFSLGILTEAILETDAGGLMADLLLMMLTAIFSLQEEEEEEEEELSKQGKEQDVPDVKVPVSDMSLNQLIDAATSMSHLPLISHGTTLRKLPLDNFTLTEILRLHILGSGAQGNLRNAKFRYQQRGGYMPIDDAGLDFKRREPDIVSRLAVDNIYDLSPSEKLKVLTLLVDQFLTYAATRDLLEDNYDKLRQLKNDLKQLQWGEQKREREEAANKYRARLEEKQRERDILEKRRLIKMKKREELIRREEATRNGAEPGQDVLDLVNDIQTMEKEVVELEASMPSQEAKEQSRTEEDDAESDKKAEYMAKEREFMEDILNLQHGNAIYPIGRDRLYRRYWMFKSVPGIFVENDELFVSSEALETCPQNPNGSAFDLNSPFVVPPKLCITKPEPSPTASPVISQESKDGSDKENDSMNTSGLNNSSVGEDTNSANVNTPAAGEPNANISSDNKLTENSERKKVNGGDAIVISDDEDSKPPSLDLEAKTELPKSVETEAIKQIQNIKEKNCKWAFFTCEEDVNKLLQSLNGRGHRERALKQAINEHKIKILDTINKVPMDLLNIPLDDKDGEMEVEDGTSSKQVMTMEWKRGRRNVTGMMQNDSAHEGLELNLREMILDLEERIHVGTLGHLRLDDNEEKLRPAWRDAIENGGYKPCTEDVLFKKEKKEEIVEEDMDTSNEEENYTMAIAKDMAKALVQIARGIESKYLQPPLGDDEKTKQAKQKADKKEDLKKKKKDKDDDESDDEEVASVRTPQRSLMERWEDSCLLSTSLAQVFLHLSTLEKSVTWSKSILHTRCRICRRKCDPDKILLCDQCDRGHHMYCLKPPIKHIPQGEWFCPDCRPKDVKRSPRKGRRRTFSEHVSSDEEKEVSEEESQSGEEDGADEASSDEDSSSCAVCSKGSTDVSCDSCPLAYHLQCAVPPLKKVPKRKWVCQICSGTDMKAGKIKMNLVKGRKKKSSSLKSTPNSSRQSSRKNSPRVSPVPVNLGKKRKREDSPVVEDKRLRRNAKSASKLVQDTSKDEVKHYVSSSRGNTKVQQLKMLEDVVLGLMEEDEAWPFLRPVLKKDAPDYYEIIKKPMDFQTIKNKINKFNYTDPAEIVQDVRQIFTNCIEYNKRTTQEFKAGASMSKLFEKRLKNLEEASVANGPTGKRARTK